jgi:sugar phosphate isomerase/epimerase
VFKNLSPNAIGIRGMALPNVIKLAAKTGYAGIDFNIREAAALAEAHGIAYVRDLFAAANVIPGQWGLPVVWNKEETQWQQEVAALPKLAQVGVELGCRRSSTWCPSGSDTRPYAENYAWHIERLRPIAQILADHGVQFGIEFLGPQTLRDASPYPFIYTLEEMMRLASDIGTGNVGLLLDAWHLYTSGGTLDDLDKITADDIVTVHVNDAPAGVPRDQLMDLVRCLPMETGVIDLPGFMRKLAQLRYAGPVTTEPFSQRINEVAARDAEAAAREVSQAMDRLWHAADLSS